MTLVVGIIVGLLIPFPEPSPEFVIQKVPETIIVEKVVKECDLDMATKVCVEQYNNIQTLNKLGERYIQK